MKRVGQREAVRFRQRGQLELRSGDQKPSKVSAEVTAVECDWRVRGKTR